jgi:hypothetical protein
MASLAKFFAKIWSKFLHKNITQMIVPFYHQLGLDAQWISLAVNKTSFEGSLLTRELQVHTKSDAYMLRFALTDKGPHAQIWQNQLSLARGLVTTEDQTQEGLNQLLDQLIEKKIHTYQRKLQNLDNKAFTSAEVTTEDKALEWIKTSFTMLEKAVVQSLTDPGLLFQTLLFIGANPKTGLEEIRLITFNLDIKYEFLPNNLLRIRIYNDKNEEFGSAKKASLEGDFNYRKREMLDELTRLLSVISAGIKI